VKAYIDVDGSLYLTTVFVEGEYCAFSNKTGSVVYCSPNIVRVIKSRRMRWAGHVARMGEERGVYRVLVGETGGKETTGET
jgi:hypothetical protein